jgi:enoyl-[acyl-carrier-protein] reductase (NADH)
MKKKMTIDVLAQITEERIQGVEKEMQKGFRSVNATMHSINKNMKDNFGLMFKVLDGLRDDVKQARAASSVEYAQLREKVEALEETEDQTEGEDIRLEQSGPNRGIPISPYISA